MTDGCSSSQNACIGYQTLKMYKISVALSLSVVCGIYQCAHSIRSPLQDEKARLEEAIARLSSGADVEGREDDERMTAIKQHLQADREKLTKIRTLLVRVVVSNFFHGLFELCVRFLSARLVRIARLLCFNVKLMKCHLELSWLSIREDSLSSTTKVSKD